VTGGTWAAKDIEYNFVAPTQALAEMNLVSSSFTAVPHNAVGFTANAGMSGDGVSAYVDTGYGLTSGQATTTSLSFGICLLNTRTTETSSYASDIGAQISGSEALIAPLNAGGTTNTAFAAANTNLMVAAPASTQASVVVSRTSSSGSDAYSNGAGVGSNTTASIIAGLPSFFLFANDGNGTPGAFLADTMAFAFAGGGLTGAQISSDHTLFTSALSAMGVSGSC
jgi:hypothetical protein